MANEMRDRLINSIETARDDWWEKAGHKQTSKASADYIADCLLDDGWVKPPYEVGQRVYVITSQTSNGKNLYIFTDIITHYHLYNLGHMVMCFENHLGEHNWNWDNVFLTKDQAEQKLKEMRGGNDL